MSTIAELRKEYGLAGLAEAEAGPDPLVLFRRWFEEAVASGLHEPNAMALATSTLQGVPSVRLVLLKALDDRGFSFFTNYDSRKAAEIAENPQVALAFPWHAIERQVRVEGRIEMVSAAESDDYFANRPIGSRLGAWASRQSEVIPDREYLQRRQDELLAQYADGKVPRPPHWGGYRVLPVVMEFWQGRPSRLHDRLRFTLQPNGTWLRERLSP